MIPLVVVVGRIRGGIIGEISQEGEMSPTYKGMTLPLTQNLKAVGLWVLFLIYCLIFSFLLLRLALGFLTISPLSKSPHHMSRSPSGRCEPSTLNLSSTLPIV